MALRVSGICHSEIAITAAASGTLIKKTQCEETCSTSQPPRTGPSAVVKAVNPDQVAIAWPRDFASIHEPIIARLPGTRNAAAIALLERPTINCARRAEASLETE